MSLRTRHIDLDASGVGTVSLAPCWFAGVDDIGGTSTVQVDDASGQSLHATAAAPYALKFSDMLPVMGGGVVVHGQNNGEVTLYFDFN